VNYISVTTLVEVEGRELDALVEREVFGREVLGEAWITPMVDTYREYADPFQQETEWAQRAHVYLGECRCADYEPSEGEVLVFGHYAACLEVCRRYASDERWMNEAWALAQYFEALDYGRMRLDLSHYHGAHCYICWGHEEGHDSGGSVFGMTAQEAISRAAVAAVRRARERGWVPE